VIVPEGPGGIVGRAGVPLTQLAESNDHDSPSEMYDAVPQGHDSEDVLEPLEGLDDPWLLDDWLLDELRLLLEELELEPSGSIGSASDPKLGGIETARVWH
jgi:hypothetical protein